MRNLRKLPTLLTGMLLLPSIAPGQLANFNPGPFSYDWDFEAPPLKGNVESIDLGREDADGHFELFKRIRFTPRPDGRREARIGPDRQPHVTITYDRDGRPLRIVRHYIQMQSNGTGEQVTAVETAKYNDKRELVSIEVRKNNKPPEPITFSAQQNPDGGRTLTWRYATEGIARVGSMTYDAHGKVVAGCTEMQGAKLKTAAYHLTYNDHGDVAELALGSPIERFEYEYDDVGNWIRRRRIPLGTSPEISGAHGETDVRKFHYRDQSTTTTSTPAGFDVADERTVPGRYRLVRGEKGSGAYNEITLICKSDGRAEYQMVTELKDERFEKNAPRVAGRRSDQLWALS